MLLEGRVAVVTGGGSGIGAATSRAEDVERLFAAVEQAHGRLDVLHNNHVWIAPGGVADVSIDGFSRSIDVGVTSYLRAIQLALPLLRSAGGAIVNTASVCGLAGDHSLTSYNVLKAGVVNLTRSVALDLAGGGVRCNCVCPGPTATPAYDALRVSHPDFWRATCAAIPMGRLAEPAEVADAILFLASNLARFVTGEALVVDGGLSAWSGLPPVPTA